MITSRIKQKNKPIFVIMLMAMFAAPLFAIGCGSADASTPEPNLPVSRTADDPPPANTITSGNLIADEDGEGNNVPRVVAVTGQSQIEVDPDTVQISLSVISQEDTVAEATSRATTAKDLIVENIQDIDSLDNISSSISIRQNYSYDDDLRESVPDGFTATYRIHFSITGDDLGGVAGRAIASAVNLAGDLLRINSVNFTRQDIEPYRAMARNNAARNARERATDYASGLGVTVGDVVSISEGNVSTYVPGSFGAAEALDFYSADSARVESVTIEEGLVSVSASVNVVFEIAN